MKLKNLTIITLMITFLIILGTKAYATTGIINEESAKLRKEPNSKTVLDLLEKGAEVEILEQQEGWYKVKATTGLGKVTGYVSEELIDTQEEDNPNVETPVEENPVEEPAETPQTTETVSPAVTIENIEEDKQYTVAQEISIKALPLINSTEKAKISGNITVIEIINDWARVESDIDSGWIRKNILKDALTAIEIPPVQETTDVQSPEITIQEPEQTTEPEVVEPEVTEPNVEEPAETKINKVGYVSAEGLRVRKGPSTDTEELTSLSKNDKVEIIGQSGNWYKIDLDGEIGYVSSKYISDTKLPETTSRGGNTLRDEPTVQTQETTTPEETVEETQTETTTPEPSTSSTNGSAVVECAKQYLGYKYVSGGASPSKGFDCSGFTQYVYKQFGISLYRTSGDQIKNGVAVEKSNLQPGDLVIFNNDANTRIGHVGIYIGDGNFIHASNPSDGVKITTLLSGYYAQRYVGARRVI